jgi:hypothetical protein
MAGGQSFANPRGRPVRWDGCLLWEWFHFLEQTSSFAKQLSQGLFHI